MKEFKSFPIFCKTISEREVSGICAVFGNVDEGGDRLHPGAFAKTLKEAGRRAKHLWNHDWQSPPIAVIKELRELRREELPEKVLQLAPEATGGLQITRQYLDTGRADEVFQGIRAGIINQMSFGFDIVKADLTVRGAQTIREVREVRLWETSDVLWGMNAATVANQSLLQMQAKALCDYLQTLPCGTLEAPELNWLGELYAALAARSTTAAQADDSRAGFTPLTPTDAELLNLEIYLSEVLSQ